jgi:O-antigen/teichoic acid export membrane protein
LLSVLFLSLISVVQANTFNLAGRQRQYLVGSIGAVVLAFITAWIGSRWIGSLTAVAWSQVISAALWWLGNEWAMRRSRLLPICEIVRVFAAFLAATAGFYLAASWDKGVLLKILFYCGLEVVPLLSLYRDELRKGLITLVRADV